MICLVRATISFAAMEESESSSESEDEEGALMVVW